MCDGNMDCQYGEDENLCVDGETETPLGVFPNARKNSYKTNCTVVNYVGGGLGGCICIAAVVNFPISIYNTLKPHTATVFYTSVQ